MNFTIYKPSSHIAGEYLKLVEQDVEREKTQGQSLVSNNMYPNTYNTLEWVSDEGMMKIITALARMFVTYQEDIVKYNDIFVPSFDVIIKYIKKHNSVYWRIATNPNPTYALKTSSDNNWHVYPYSWDMQDTSIEEKQRVVGIVARYFYNINSLT